jgi:hypothetical protein
LCLKKTEAAIWTAPDKAFASKMKKYFQTRRNWLSKIKIALSEAYFAQEIPLERIAGSSVIA